VIGLGRASGAWAEDGAPREPGAAPLAELVAAVRDRLAGDGSALTPHLVAAALREAGRPVGDATVLAVHAALVRDAVGAGPLEPLLRLPGVTDVLVDGPGRVLLDRGRGLEDAGVRFASDDEVRRLAQRLAATAGRRLDDATPYADVRLADGTRLHAVLAPLARTGTALSLRVPRRRVFTLAELTAEDAVSPAGARLLAGIVSARLAFLVSGGTGTGKTTLLAALLSLVEPGERLVLVEDSGELRPDHPHVVALEARPANVEGIGEVTLRTLVRQALRMRPDRLVVGEVRSGEVVDLLAALNTGHEGGCGTLHANSAADVPARIEALALAAGLPRNAAHSQLAAALDVVLHLHRGRDGRRRLEQVAVLRREGPWVRAETAVAFDGHGRPTPGPGADELDRRLGNST
jgi:pilus assembly protein CpaF